MVIKVQSVPIFRKVTTNSAKVVAPVKVEAIKLAPVTQQILDDEVKININAPYLFLTGEAGTGKTTLVRKTAQDNPDYVELCATTGIAAINLDTKTINSTLKYYDTESLLNNYKDGRLHFYLRTIRQEKLALGVDEGSMLSSDQLDILFDAIYEINQDENPRKLGFHIIGDLLQLPPVKAKMIINASCWSYFKENTIKLKKIWRQDNAHFVKAINLIRAGDGNMAVKTLLECGVQFISKTIDKFDGTTLIPKNDGVDIYNAARLAEVQSPIITSLPQRRGDQLGEWKAQIPNIMRFKIGAYVMILSNNCPDFDYVNGDCGYIEEYNEKDEEFKIRLKRNDKIVSIGKITRMNTVAKQPTHNQFSPAFTPYVDQFTHRWVIGDISYHPMRLAYATTIHKSQGLSLDKVQIDISPWNFGLPAMAYVAVSRCKTPEGLTIVGTPEMLAKKIVTERSVLEYV